MTKKFLQLFPNLNVEVPYTLGFDHLHPYYSSKRKKIFRFETKWMNEQSFKQIILDNWLEN